MCLHVVSVCCAGTGAYTTEHVALAEPQDLPGATETRNQGSGAVGGGGATLLTASPRRGARGGQVWPGWRAATGLTHLTCRPSCCTPRAGSSDTPSTPAWWAPRRRTPPGPRRGICGRERRDLVPTTWLARTALPSLGAPQASVVAARSLGSPSRTFSPTPFQQGPPMVSLLCAPQPSPADVPLGPAHSSREPSTH